MSCGISTNIGLESAARFAYKYGYEQIFAEDATAARSNQENEHTMKTVFPSPENVPTEFRRKLIAPEIIVPPLLWLVSDAADGVSGKRINAALWNEEPDEGLKFSKASEPAGWDRL